MTSDIENIESNKLLQVPNIVLPADIQFIDDFYEHPNSRLLSPHVRHSSLRTKSTKENRRKLCRHHSDSSSRGLKAPREPKQQPATSRNHSMRRSSRKVKRSASAIESKNQNLKTGVRRSVSERSGDKTRKYLGVPLSNRHDTPQNSSLSFIGIDGDSSCRCSRTSSTKTVISKASLSELVAVEMGTKNIPGITAKEARRRRVVFTIAVVATALFVVCISLVAVTLLLSPVVDAVLRKENEELYGSMSSGTTTGAPVPNGSSIVGNDTIATNGQPG